MGGYALFFVGAGLIGLPAVLLCVLLAAREPKPAQVARTLH